MQLEPIVDGFSITDGAFDPGLMRALKEWFVRATVWHTVIQGRILQATLLDGLNCQAVVNMARALKSQLRRPTLVLENIWAWKYHDHVDAPMAYNNSFNEPPDLMAAIWVDGGEGEGLELVKGPRKHFIKRQGNRIVLWGSDWTGVAVRKEKGLVQYKDRRVDLMMSFRRSLGLKLYPGLTESRRWSAPQKGA